ncbi:Aste57867_929 [Aphanomyces stellatus]|uniref:Aste57867_929 protein n=1 Tax=Aphanomyces stellatus TaxID=120398 RepID=A0A485K7Z8_9STRA|nr:hypothetical protein As57867_000928 [Aphanomyces stellatus]VFT78152.1 Aste57867_929 [Aphanomyces stellatus]
MQPPWVLSAAVACVVTLYCARVGHASPSILFNMNIEIEGRHVPLVFHDGLEPIDVIEDFRAQHRLSLDFQQRALQTVCKSLSCTRASPVVYQTAVHGDNNEPIGTFELLQDDEPADAVHAFAARHGMSKAFAHNLLHSLCNVPSITCTRDGTLLFRQAIRDETGAFLGTLEVLDTVEPVDTIFAFLQPLFAADRARMEHMLRQLLHVVCRQPGVTCARTYPRLFHRRITDANGTDHGLLEIFYGQEPVDMVFAFGEGAGLSSAMQRNLLVTVCNDALTRPYCTRDRAQVFSAPIQLDESGNAGVLTLYDGDEVADVLFHFGRRANLTFGAKSQLFSLLCNRPPITCTRGHAVVYSRRVALDPSATDEDAMGRLEIMEGDEPADAVYAFAAAHQLTNDVREHVLNTVCDDMHQTLNVSCTRFAPVVFQVPISKNASEPPVGVLQVLQGEEPVDAIVRFGREHDLDEFAQKSILDGVCEASQLPCTRERSLLYVAVVNNEGVPFYADDEPADVVHWYGTDRNWTFVERKEWLAELCRIRRAGAPLLNCSRAEARLFKLPVMETPTKEIGVLEVLEDQEPIDQVYAFLEKHDLFQTAPVNTSLRNVTCANVQCVRDRPRRILFSMHATYMGLPHTIQLVQPEEDWICTEAHGSKKCQHYVEVKSTSYCAKQMPGWPECANIMGDALRHQLTLYEEALWKLPNTKDLYAKLGLVKGATSDEIEAAYHRLVLRFNNMTEPQKYEKLRAAYETLHDPEKKFYYDLPCLKFFGLCGKRQADGGISISMDN